LGLGFDQTLTASTSEDGGIAHTIATEIARSPDHQITRSDHQITNSPDHKVQFMSLIDPGKKAPAFSLTDQHGKTHTLADYSGRPVILYFYPKDDTPGCTTEACAFQDNLPTFGKSKAVVLGVSVLDEKSKAKFAAKYSLTFPLLADPDHAVIDRYGAWQEKSMYGRKYMGVARITYLIDADGKVAQRWDSVKVKEHAEEVLEAVKDL
jgi:thioredoxin-dependent peroxiredoxin